MGVGGPSEILPSNGLEAADGEMLAARAENLTGKVYHLDVQFQPRTLAPVCKVIEKI